MKYINLLLLTFLIVSCSNHPSKESAFVAISNANQTLEGRLIGLEGKSLSKLTLEEIIAAANEMDAEDQIFVRYKDILKKAKDIKIFPREESFVMCMKWTDIYLCDLSQCMGIEYSSADQQLKNPEELKCK